MCFRNSPGINLVASTMSHDAVFTLICSQDCPFPWAFQLHWERTSRTKVRKLMSLAQDSLTEEGKRTKTSGTKEITHRLQQAEQLSNGHLRSWNSTVFFLYPSCHSWAWHSLQSMEYPFGQFGSAVAPSSTGKLSLLHLKPASSQHWSSANGCRISGINNLCAKRSANQLTVKLPMCGGWLKRLFYGFIFHW